MIEKQHEATGDALRVVNRPDRFASQPDKRLLAWAILLGQRGQRVNQTRLRKMQRHLREAA